MLENWKYTAIVRDINGNVFEVHQATSISGFKALFKIAMGLLRNEMHTGILGTTIAFYRYSTKLFTLRHIGTDPVDGDWEYIEFQRPGDWYSTYIINEMTESFDWGKRR